MYVFCVSVCIYVYMHKFNINHGNILVDNVLECISKCLATIMQVAVCYNFGFQEVFIIE